MEAMNRPSRRSSSDGSDSQSTSPHHQSGSDSRPPSSVDFPEPLQETDEPAQDGAEAEDASGPPMFMNMNQSIFGLIAAAGSRGDFEGRYDDDSTSSEDEDKDGGDNENHDSSDGGAEHEQMAQTTILTPSIPRQGSQSNRTMQSERHMLKSMPFLPKSTSEQASRSTTKSSLGSQRRQGSTTVGKQPAPPLSKSRSAATDPSRHAPVMSRMLEARAEITSRPSFEAEALPVQTQQDAHTDSANPLEQRLMEIFGFPEAEQVIEEYPCWLLQSVLLQGFLYLTARHICFYAHLPKKTRTVIKSGFLSKSGKRNPRFNRFWFRLKGNVLSYYRDSTNLYFPHGHIDLTYGIAANVNEGDKDQCRFTITTSSRTYNFKADSAPSAKEWVKSLQRVIFRNQNNGENVKISLPIASVMEVKETQMMEFADTCRITVCDNDETYAIDEYYFSFFSSGRDAIRILQMFVEDAGSSQTVDKVLERQRQKSLEGHRPPSRKSGRADSQARHASTKSRPLRQESDTSSESTDSDKTSGRAAQHPDSRNATSEEMSHVRASSESFLQSSLEDPSFSNITESSAEDPSASQILSGSALFHSPTMHRSPRSSQNLRQAESPRKVRVRHESSQETATDKDRSTAQDKQAGSLQHIGKMGTYPLQRAGAFAEYVNKTGKKMSSLLATESMGYVEKVSGMWKGGGRHYQEPAGLKVDDEGEMDEEDGQDMQGSNERFRAHFALPESESLQATYFGNILRVLPLYGKIYISDRFFCFRSLLPGTRTKLILPLKDIENVDKEKGFRFGYSGLVVVIRGHEELFFEFGQSELRDDCAVTLLRSLEATRYLKESGLLSPPVPRRTLSSSGHSEPPRLPQQTSILSTTSTMLRSGDGTEASLMQFKPPHAMRITCLTIGSRGDVQPYISLCKGLLAEGHRPCIATHAEFQGWVESHGIEFARVEGDPGELMRLCIENGTFTWAFLREANSTFRGWLDELLESAWHACKGSDMLIESPSAMGGIHIAEKLGIPYFRAFTMPWTRTRAYPHAFIMPEHKMGGAYNYMTYVMFDNIFWKATAHQINRWRNKTLGLPNTSLEKLQPNKVPFLYNFSPSVVGPPVDFSDWIRVTGYWFLDEENRYEPPQELADFIAKCRADGKKLVYVGFGSIIVNDPAKMTQEVIDAVLKADVRCILSKGWSDRMSMKQGAAAAAAAVVAGSQIVEEPQMPPEIHVIKSAPHDWLFKQIDAAAHHGGSGTTGASLRAGIPTIIRPFFGDQFFFASRVEDLGVGVWVKKWGTNSFGRALWEVTRNQRMIDKARLLGERIRREHGVETAIQALYRDMEYAKSLIQAKALTYAKKAVDASAPSAAEGGASQQEDDEEEETYDEEAWTFVGGDEPDPDVVTRKLSEMVGTTTMGLGVSVVGGDAM